MTPDGSISIVMPAYNEEDNIEAAVDAARVAVEELHVPWEIVVIDDGSRDATPERLAVLSQRNGRIRVLTHAHNRGYGAALRSGFRAARGDLIFYTDSDRQFDMGELQYFLPMMDTTDVALGFRVSRYDAVLRCMLSWIYNRLVTVLFRVRVRDVDCSFKLFRREVLESIDLETSDFFIDTELVSKARRWNFRIIEKGVHHYPRTAGQSTVRASDIPRTLRTVGLMWTKLYLRPPSARSRVERACPRVHEPIPPVAAESRTALRTSPAAVTELPGAH